MRRNIPRETTSFVGRSAELARLHAALGEARLVTLVGAAGVGKSRLALRAVTTGTAAEPARTPGPVEPERTPQPAETAAPAGAPAEPPEPTEPPEPADLAEFASWADLWPVQDDGLLAAVLADALGLADHTARSPAEALCAWVADRPVLLVLDSCEHLIPQCRQLLARLLSACPRLRVLATSREPLGAEGETVLRVPPLAAATEALTLFEQRAAGAGAPLRDAGERRGAALLCARLDGVPLALELAAAQLRHHTLDQTVRRAQHPLDLSEPAAPGATPSTDGAPAAPDRPARHTAVRTAVGWSHELCRPAERLLWARLAVFPRAFDAGIAEQVCSGGPLSPRELRTCLRGLVDKSVVTREGGRYRLLDSIREYGAMWLRELGEEEYVEARHASAVVELSRRARTQWFGAAQASWYRRMEELYHDVHAALRRLLVTHPEQALELAGNVAFFWVCCGHLHETGHYLELALASTDRPGPCRTRGLWSLGVAHVLQGDHAAGRELAALSRESAARTGDSEGLRQAAYLEGLAALLTGRPLEALTAAEGALRSTADHPEPGFGVLLCRLVRVFALTGAGRLKEARLEADVLRRKCVRVGDCWTRAYTDYQLALIALFEHRYEEAAAHARDMLAAKRRIGDRFGIALGLELLAAAWAESGRPRHAALAYGAGAQHWEIVGHPQRGTPEVAPLRERGRESARVRIGEAEYAELFHSALHADRDRVVAWATAPDPAPHL
ncbi:regulator [Streptomyces sp. ODS28]|uniref:ATP-binding protein n=1 Tax=Streptomyces sp. ODS28 TaxID=3136688 RepID=UPI0031E8B7EC